MARFFLLAIVVFALSSCDSRGDYDSELSQGAYALPECDEPDDPECEEPSGQAENPGVLSPVNEADSIPVGYGCERLYTTSPEMDLGTTASASYGGHTWAAGPNTFRFEANWGGESARIKWEHDGDTYVAWIPRDTSEDCLEINENIDPVEGCILGYTVGKEGAYYSLDDYPVVINSWSFFDYGPYGHELSDTINEVIDDDTAVIDVDDSYGGTGFGISVDLNIGGAFREVLLDGSELFCFEP